MAIILKSQNKIDALEIIKDNGFIDTTPEIGLCTSKIFAKENRKYKFVGWHKLVKKSGCTCPEWQDIEIEEVI